jgi:hypothetical protein
VIGTAAIGDRVALATTGFLIAVLWFDLMFDVQVARHRAEVTLPDDVLASISRYYRRVTTDASPMGRLIAFAMLGLVVALVAQAIEGDVDRWVTAVSIAGAVTGPGLAAVRVVPNARRLGGRVDDASEQSRLARSIWRDHLFCFAAMVVVLIAQLAA